MAARRGTGGPPAIPELVGRRDEMAVLAALVERGSVAGGALVLHGDPGIGKSALLAATARRASAGGRRVLTTVGVQPEAQLPFAGLHQVLAPVLASAGHLHAAHRDALRTAFGLLDGPPPEPFLVALAAANLLAAVAAEAPVVVLADDVHWLDPPSQEVLTFLARRAAGRPVVVVGALRSGHPCPMLSAALPELEVRGVDDAAAWRILLAHAGDLRFADRRRIRREAQGNPLALLELPAACRRPDPAAAGPGTTSLPERLERAFADRLDGLPARTRDAVLVAASDPASDLAEILAATSALGGGPVAADVLDPAVAARLVVVAGGLVSFRHPLVRSAVLQSETLSRRQTANAALAAVLVDQPYRRTRHRAQSIVGPDDEIADELETTGLAAARRGGIMSAIADLERSAQLTRGSAGRGRRLLLAAEHAFSLGRADMVDRLVGAAARTDLSDLDRARMEWLREIFNDGIPGDATRVLELCDIAERSTRADDDDLALNLLLGAALRCWWADTGPQARARVVEVAGRLPRAGTDPRQVAAVAVAEPVAQAVPVMRMLSEVVVDAADADGPRLLGMAAHAVGDEVRAADFLDLAETRLRDQGRLGVLPQVLSMQVQVRTELGEWDRATDAAREGQLLAQETGQPIWSAGTLVRAARTDALRGNVERALRLAAEAELAANRQRLNDLLSCVQLARGSAWLSAGRYAEAYTALRRLFDPADPSFHQRERFAGVSYLAEAAAYGGRREDARAVLADLERVATTTPSPVLHVHLLYARAALADDVEAEGRYRAALGEDLGRWPWIRARVQLGYGAWLCRHGRSAEARRALHPARATLEMIGARAWVGQVREVLRTA